MANEQSNSANPNVDLKYRRKKNAEEMKHQVISFTLMIFFTLIAFSLQLELKDFHIGSLNQSFCYWRPYKWFSNCIILCI